MDEILLLHRPELAVRDGISGDRIELHVRDDKTYTLRISGYDGLLIGLTTEDLLQIAIALLNAIRMSNSAE